MDTNSKPETKLEIQNEPDFSKVVADSKANVHAQPQKRTRGPYKKRERTGGNQVSGAAAPNSGPSLGGPSVASQPGAAPDVSKHLMAPIKMVSKIPANLTQIPQLAFDDEEAYAVAFSLNELLNAYNPNGQMNPKTAALLSFGVTMGSIGIAKFSIYAEVKNERLKARKQIQKVETKAPENTGEPFPIEAADKPKIPVDEYFKNQ